MPIQILPIISAISSFATTTWEIYRKATEARDAKRTREVNETLASRVQDLEDSMLDQLRLINELSERMKDFTQAVQEEIEEHQNKQARLMKIIYGALAISVISLGLCVFLFVR